MDSPLSIRLSFAEGSDGVRKVNVPNQTLVTADDRLVQIDSVVVSHHGGDKEKIEKCININRYQVEQFAYFIGKLKATQEAVKAA